MAADMSSQLKTDKVLLGAYLELDGTIKGLEVYDNNFLVDINKAFMLLAVLCYLDRIESLFSKGNKLHYRGYCPPN